MLPRIPRTRQQIEQNRQAALRKLQQNRDDQLLARLQECYRLGGIVPQDIPSSPVVIHHRVSIASYLVLLQDRAKADIIFQKMRPDEKQDLFYADRLFPGKPLMVLLDESGDKAGQAWLYDKGFCLRGRQFSEHDYQPVERSAVFVKRIKIA